MTLHERLESLAKRIPPSAGVLEAIDEKSCVHSGGSNSLDSITFHLLALGIEFQVHEPAGLVQHIAKLARRLTGATPR